jgi:RNA polymerase sigma-70 factor, ECF subfamily
MPVVDKDGDGGDGGIAEITAFHDPRLFPAFGLPATLPPADR